MVQVLFFERPVYSFPKSVFKQIFESAQDIEYHYTTLRTLRKMMGTGARGGRK